MNGRVKELWLAALRSGKYEQTTNMLHLKIDGKSKFCCLGVLCEIASTELDITVEEKKDKVFYDNEFNILSNKILKWAGLPRNIGDPLIPKRDLPEIKGVIFGGSNSLISLGLLNDDYRLSFDKIADIIEREL